MAISCCAAATENGSRRCSLLSRAGELRASLRSIAAYAPWVRHVYVIVAGQTQIPGRKGDWRYTRTHCAHCACVRACVRAFNHSSTRWARAAWLDAHAQFVTVVFHETIFAESARQFLPTFSSVRR